MIVFIFDLDNTLYPVKSINYEVGLPILTALQKVNSSHKNYTENEVQSIFKDCWNIQFDELSVKYELPALYEEELIKAYDNLSIDHDIHTFPDADILLDLEGDKYLVSTGYEKLQLSKIEKLNLKNIFKNIYIDIPSSFPRKTKEYYFRYIMGEYIMGEYNIPPKNFVVIGDNINSEIKYANKLEMISVLVNRESKKIVGKTQPTFTIKNLWELKTLPFS